ncbi:dihydroneopterin aldolase [Sphingobacterium spiritivorum]|uniref:dihydroneopterin aldolase n=1 Tax=Sphingobacterium spiritivorum TaxID=258 RepID=UPI003DA6C558
MATRIQTIAINAARFYAPVGYYAEEIVTGNEFLVDIEVSYPYKVHSQDELTNTLNYEQLYAIAADVMKQKRKLIESAVEEILETIVNQFHFAEQVNVSITKINPLFGGDRANSRIALSYTK